MSSLLQDGEAGEHQDYSYSSGHLSRESFETSGGVSSTHNDLLVSHSAVPVAVLTFDLLVPIRDKLELLNSLQDLKLDNKRLQDRNHQLQTQVLREGLVMYTGMEEGGVVYTGTGEGCVVHTGTGEGGVVYTGTGRGEWRGVPIIMSSYCH